MRTLLIAATVVALLQGCATGGSPPTSRVSGLDGSRVVTVPGHGNACSGVERAHAPHSSSRKIQIIRVRARVNH